MPKKYVKRWERGQWPRPSIEVYFWERVSKQSNGCWLWTGALTGDGYGILRRQTMHRWSYEKHRGEIPEGLEVDHLCSVRNCVNPDHMELVTHRENVQRSYMRGKHDHRLGNLGKHKAAKTHCPQGHAYAGENLLIDKYTGARRCKACTDAKFKRYQAKLKERENV